MNKLCQVFEASARNKIPNVQIEKVIVKPPSKDTNHGYDTCHSHLKACEKILRDKVDVIVCDCDLLFMKDITDLWKEDFDMAFTIRKAIPYNTGIWWFRYNDKSVKFVKEWIKNTIFLRDRYKNDDEPCRRFVRHHGGLDQASLAITVDNNTEAKLLFLESQKWNACQHEWIDINKDVKIIHIKSMLRKYCLGQAKEPPEHLLPIIKIWRKYYGYSKHLYRLDKKTKNKRNGLRNRNKKGL